MNKKPEIYFAASIRGGRDRVHVYSQIAQLLSKYGVVLTEHVGDSSLTSGGEKTKIDEFIFKRDKLWILQSDFVVAEVTNPSLGVGWEIAFAESVGKKVFCLYFSDAEKKLSAMIAGNSQLNICMYKTLQDVELFLNEQLFLFSQGEMR
jgi:nucleoside 2-deoxyribosyltransferase